MSSNLTEMKRRAKETPLKHRYARLHRESTPSPGNAPPQGGDYPSPLPGLPRSVHLSAEEPPVSGWQLLADFPDSRVLKRPNGLLLYRVLKTFFGDSDLLGVYVNDFDATADSQSAVPFTTDWGFSFWISEHLVAEVRSLSRNSRVVVRLWAENPDEARRDHEHTARAFDGFLQDLRNAVEGNLHLFDEKSELRSATDALPDSLVRGAIVNVARERYDGARRLLEAAGVLQDTEAALELDEPFVREGTNESLLLGAATLFVVSLEAFVNVIYSLLLKQDFQDERYERLLNRLKEFRNDLIHGNVTEEHRAHVLPEGVHAFYYAPFRDYRGPAKERKAQQRIRRFTLNIDDGIRQESAYDRG